MGTRHLHDGRLSGPDQGVRWNIRLGRFVKSYLPFLRPRERYYFLQGQGYWACASWTLGDLTGDPAFHEVARAATRVIAATQRPDGAWDYPLPERRHLVATVEGDFGASALLEGHRYDHDASWLERARRWTGSRAGGFLPRTALPRRCLRAAMMPLPRPLPVQ